MPHVRAVVLAAGAGRRFGGLKLEARIGGKPVLQHVLDTLAEAGLANPIVVVSGDGPAGIEWRDAELVPNPDPGRGLASSLQLGWSWAMARVPPAEAVLLVLGDQPLLRADVVRRIVAEPLDPARPLIATRYTDTAARNPVRIEPEADELVAGGFGDMGLAPSLSEHPELVRFLDAAGGNPDIDRRADLQAVGLAMWADRVRGNAAQVARVRETADDADHYAPVTSMFRDDPRRTGDEVLDALLHIARPGDRWLDVGAGAGRFALPLALVTRAVIAVEPSSAMLEALRDGLVEHSIDNVRVVEGRWPAAASLLGAMPVADHALIAQVGYDVEDIGPFLDALEAAASQGCVAVMRERSPAAAAEPFWVAVHGEQRISLPALADLLDLLSARGTSPEVEWIEHVARTFPSRNAALGFLRRQTWVAPGSVKDRRLASELEALLRQPGHVLPDGSIRLSPDPTVRDSVVRWHRS